MGVRRSQLRLTTEPLMEQLLDYLRSLTRPEAYPPAKVLLEMAMIGAVVYTVLRFLHGTRGARLLQGLVSLLVASLVILRVAAERLALERITVLMQPFILMILLTTLVVFQPELRRGLMRLGETRWRRTRRSEVDRVVRPVAAACAELAKTKIGALIAIERDIGLSGLTDQGVKLDARLSSELLMTLFWPGTALHDLGVIIQRGRVAAAGCPFPLADEHVLDRTLGSRHRAALGLSLDSDAVVVVVSEETGAISIAEGGRLERHIPPDRLAAVLRSHLMRMPESSPDLQEGPDEDLAVPPSRPLGLKAASAVGSAGKDAGLEAAGGERPGGVPPGSPAEAKAT